MQRFGFLHFLAAFVAAALCLSDTALGQPTLTATDANNSVLADNDIATATPQNSTLAYTAVTGTTTSQTIRITASAATTITFSVNNQQGQSQPPAWLRINGLTFNPATNVNPSTDLVVSANTVGLTQGTYSGVFQVYVTGASVSTALTFTVNLTVGGSSLLSANPNTLSFTAIQGSSSGSPSFTSVQINSSSVAINYTLNVSTQQGNWLLTNTTTGTTGGVGFVVSVNPSGLSAGTYQGTITAQSTTTFDAVAISVTLTVTSTSSLTISPASPPPFLYQIGGAAPTSQTLTLTSNGPTISFSVASNTAWLVPSPLSGISSPNSPATIQLAVNTTGLVVGTYDATLSITPLGSNSQQVPIRLVVSNNPLLQVSPNTMTFSAPFSGQVPAAKTAQVTATGAGSAVFFSTTSNQTWLTAVANQNFAAAGSPATLTVSINQSALAVGTYTGTITITPTNGDNYFQTIEVTMVVGTTTQISAGPSVLLFSFQTTRSLPGAQQVTIQSTGQPTSFTLSTVMETCTASSNWLLANASQLSTPAQLTVNVQAAGMPNGTCKGKIVVTPASGNLIEVPVSVIVSANPLLTLSQPNGFGFEVVQQGAGSAIPRSLSVGSTDNSQLAFTVASNQTWLLVGGGGTTPQSLNVFIQPAGLLPGIYGGTITITSTAIPEGFFSIPVTLLVNPNVTVSVSPLQLSFAMSQGGALPAAQNLTLTSSGGSPTFTATVSQTCTDLLSVSPTSGLAAGTITVTLLSNSRSVGTHSCQVNLAYQNAATTGTTIQVSVTINTARTLNVPSTPLTFAYQLTQSAPASQTIRITATGGEVEFTVGTTSTPAGWLSTNTTTATTPRDVVVSVNTTGLGIGTYNGSLSVSAPGVLTNPVTIAVTLTVTAAPTPQPVTITSTASNLAGAISPGALITIKGTLLGPTDPPNGVLFTVNSQGRIDSTLAGVRVLFDGVPGTPIFVSAAQINVFVPYEIAGRLNVNVVVEYRSVSSTPIGVRVTDAAPAIFTINQQGFGQAAALNQNGTFNGPIGGNTIPSPINTILAIYTTGGGQTNPPSATGGVTPSSPPLRQIPPVGSRSATIAGLPAVVEFAGAAPGLAAGVEQWNIRIPIPPTGSSISGNQQIVITINGVSSPVGPTVAIQ